jgi:DUF4097 and DUF4098 domain-containing protein YvlB
MASPTPPTVPPPYRHRRSFAGPAVLIILGVVFLLGNLHMIAWGRLGMAFAHYWPLLLILWVVLKIIEHQQAQRDGLPARGIGAGGVCLVIFIVICGLIATHAARFHWDELRDNLQIDDGDLDNIFGDTFNYDDHLEQDIPAGVTNLRVNDDRGAVRISAADDNKITVTIRKKIGAESQGDADRYNSQTKPAITVTGNGMALDARTQAAGGDRSVETDLDISVPRKMMVQITSRRGEVSVTDRVGELAINTQHGDVSLENVTGNVALNLDHSSAKIEQITGDVHIDGHLNEVSVTDVKGSLQLDGEFNESVKLARISNNVLFKSSRTDLEFSRIDGELDLDSDDLHAEQLFGPVHLTTHSKEINLEDVSGDVRVQDANGGVEVSMRSLGNVQIDDRNGDIHLSVPDKAGFRLDAQTRDGEIESDFPDLKIDNNDHESKATGTVGNGASHIVLNNEHDGIEIRKAGMQSMHPPGPAPVPNPAPKPGRNLPAPKTRVEPTEN